MSINALSQIPNCVVQYSPQIDHVKDHKSTSKVILLLIKAKFRSQFIISPLKIITVSALGEEVSALNKTRAVLC